MGNVMISLDDEKEMQARQLAQELYGGKKGSLSEIFAQALVSYITQVRAEHERKSAHARLIQWMKKGANISYRGYATRSELYGHRLKSTDRH